MLLVTAGSPKYEAEKNPKEDRSRSTASGFVFFRIACFVLRVYFFAGTTGTLSGFGLGRAAGPLSFARISTLAA